jgi:hypothetical protein
MKTDPIIKLPDADELCRLGYSEGAIAGVMYARELSDEDVLCIARDADHSSEPYQAMLRTMGQDTNPWWITSRCAGTAWERGLIDDTEHDWITR